MTMKNIQLFPHQTEALKQTDQMNKVAYYLDMGLGKTYVGSEKMMELGKNVNLLICQKSKVNDWVQHFKEYYAELRIFDLTDKKQLSDYISRDKAWAGYHGAIMTVGIINYELAFRRKNLLDLRDFTLMLDESSMIQNESAKRSKFILKLKAQNVILLSGTPTSGKYENLYSQLKLLGWNISKDLYWNQYVDSEWIDQDGFFRRQVNGYKNVDRLKQKLRQHGAVFMKSEEVFDLPEQIFNKVMVPVSKEYKKFMRSSIITIEENELVGDTTLTKRLYARMLCGQYNKDKLEAFMDLVESTSDRLIVFYNFNDELAAMKALIEDRPMSVINGSVKDLEAYDNCDDSITFVQYQAGAMGLNLQKANKIIYFTLPQSSELFEQSKKRTHRIGQNNTCFYYYLMCEKSVEEDILQTLEMRRDYSDELFKKHESEYQ